MTQKAEQKLNVQEGGKKYSLIPTGTHKLKWTLNI